VAYCLIASQWRAVFKSIKKAKEIYVVGYGFPKEDHYGRFIFQEAAKQNSKLKKIWLYERDVCVEKELKEIFRRADGKEIPIVYKGPVTSPLANKPQDGCCGEQ